MIKLLSTNIMEIHLETHGHTKIQIIWKLHTIKTSHLILLSATEFCSWGPLESLWQNSRFLWYLQNCVLYCMSACEIMSSLEKVCCSRNTSKGSFTPRRLKDTLPIEAINTDSNQHTWEKMNDRIKLNKNISAHVIVLSLLWVTD